METDENLEKRIDENNKAILGSYAEREVLKSILDENDYKIFKEIASYLINKKLGFRIKSYNQLNDKELELSVYSWCDPDDREKTIEELIRYTYHPEESDPNFAQRIFKYKPKKPEEEPGEYTPCFYISRNGSEKYIAVCFDKCSEKDE
jgi:hypothetical protein